jgi:hypothetical protein
LKQESMSIFLPENEVAKVFAAAVRCGHPVGGTVVELTADEDRASVIFSIPLLGERKVYVANTHNLHPGDHVEIHAVRVEGKLKFQVAKHRAKREDSASNAAVPPVTGSDNPSHPFLIHSSPRHPETTTEQEFPPILPECGQD